MKTSILTSFALAATALAVDIAWDAVYDDGNTSLDVVSCSDGDNGLETRYQYKTFKDVPSFPFVGGAPGVDWNSPQCGVCWELTYSSPGFTKTIHFTAIDAGGSGYVTGKNALNQLTNGRADELGIAPVTAKVVSPSACGLPN